MRIAVLWVCAALCGCEEEVDADADGYPAEDDCDDNDASIHPGADEVWYDGIAQGCDVDVDPSLEFRRLSYSDDLTEPAGPRLAHRGGTVDASLVFGNEGELNGGVLLVTPYD